ncbi:MAG: Pyrophosphatase PpaX [Candidatus Heimdallarchaeota archaeon LC_2]|nr:MAG: Pyrophosphatase PpaX [Candidatus Heimdallarchaeota archaeon LC_2]
MNNFDEVELLLFDMDGTLTDLRKRWWDPFFRAYDHVRPNSDKDEGEAIFTNSFEDIIKHSGGKSRFIIPKIIWKVTRAMGLNLIETVKLLRYIRKDKLAFKEIIPLEGSENVVRELTQRGYKLALVTTASRKTIDIAQNELEFFDLFEPIITRDDVKATKPEPEPLLLACKKLNISIEQSVMIGDFPLDIQAGKSAGSRTIAVLGPNEKYTRSLIEKENPDVILKNLTELLPLFPYKSTN